MSWRTQIQQSSASKPIGCLTSLLWLIVTLVAAGVFLSRPSELLARSIGGVFQLLGIAAVAWGVKELRKEFKVPPLRADLENEVRPLWSNAKNYLRRLLRRRENVTVIPGTGKITASGFASAATLGKVVSRMNVGQKVEWLVEEMEKVNAGVRQLQTDLTGYRDDTTRDINAESAKRAEMKAQLEEMVTSLAVGGLRVEIVGLVWLVAGTLLATWPEEISRLLGG